MTALTLSRIHAKSKGSEAGLLAIADPVFRERDDRASTAQNKGPTGVLASLFRRLMAAEETDQMGGLKFPRLRLTGNLAKALSEMYKKGRGSLHGVRCQQKQLLE